MWLEKQTKRCLSKRNETGKYMQKTEYVRRKWQDHKDIIFLERQRNSQS